MSTRTDRLPTLLDIDGVAEHLGVNERHVRRLVAERRIPFVKWGHLLRFDPAEIAAWLDRHASRSAGGDVRDTPDRYREAQLSLAVFVGRALVLSEGL